MSTLKLLLSEKPKYILSVDVVLTLCTSLSYVNRFGAQLIKTIESAVIAVCEQHTEQ